MKNIYVCGLLSLLVVGQAVQAAKVVKPSMDKPAVGAKESVITVWFNEKSYEVPEKIFRTMKEFKNHIRKNIKELRDKYFVHIFIDGKRVHGHGTLDNLKMAKIEIIVPNITAAQHKVFKKIHEIKMALAKAGLTKEQMKEIKQHLKAIWKNLEYEWIAQAEDKKMTLVEGQKYEAPKLLGEMAHSTVEMGVVE